MGENIYPNEKKEKEKVAIKIEDKQHSISILKNETRVLEYLARNGCRTQIPQIYWFGKINIEQRENHGLVMTYFVGNSLEKEEEIMKEEKETKINKWMISALEIIEKIHFYGVLHRDLKPAHFIFVEKTQKWVLIDFGFATFFSENIETFEKEFIIGTPNYISLNIHNGLQYTPIDDIWSLIYIYIRILYPELFIFSLENENEKTNIYPQNHILNNENQIRKERKILFNYPDFWEKYLVEIPIQKNKIYLFIQIILQFENDNNNENNNKNNNKKMKKIPYKYLSSIFELTPKV